MFKLQYCQTKPKAKIDHRVSFDDHASNSTYPSLFFPVKLVKRHLWSVIYNIHHILITFFDRTKVELGKRVHNSFRRHFKRYWMLRCVTHHQVDTEHQVHNVYMWLPVATTLLLFMIDLLPVFIWRYHIQK